VPGEVVTRRAAELRALAARKGAEHATRRAGGSADVVVVGDEAGRRHGLTEDYLSVALDEPAPPRGSRFAGRLEMRDGRLAAVASVEVHHSVQ
jgi:tRNA A37 methylthiotransferase MiaB